MVVKVICPLYWDGDSISCHQTNWFSQIWYINTVHVLLSKIGIIQFYKLQKSKNHLSKEGLPYQHQVSASSVSQGSKYSCFLNHFSCRERWSVITYCYPRKWSWWPGIYCLLMQVASSVDLLVKFQYNWFVLGTTLFSSGKWVLYYASVVFLYYASIVFRYQ